MIEKLNYNIKTRLHRGMSVVYQINDNVNNSTF